VAGGGEVKRSQCWGNLLPVLHYLASCVVVHLHGRGKNSSPSCSSTIVDDPQESPANKMKDCAEHATVAPLSEEQHETSPRLTGDASLQLGEQLCACMHGK